MRSRRHFGLIGAVFSSLRGYRRAFIAPDLIAGVTLLVIAVPEQLATSRLAGMPPITGFYAFIAGTFVFAMLGSSSQLSVGADSTIAPLFAVGISHLALSGSPRYIDLVGILAVVVGAIVALVSLLRLGWIAEFLSTPIIVGFLAGVAVIIVVHQLPDFFGLPSPSGTTLHRVYVVASHLGAVNGWSVAIGAVVLIVVIVTERIDKRLPGALVGLVGSTLLVGLLGLGSHGVATLGPLAHGAPRIGLYGLSWAAIRQVVPVALVVALLVVSQTAATTRAFADQGGYQVDVGRDFLAVGVGNIAAGLFGSFPVNASPARTAAIASASGRTQAAGLGAAAALVVLIPAAGLLKDVPLATLAAVLIFVATRIFHRRELRAIAHFDLFEFALAIVTLLIVALVGVEQGIVAAVALAILDRTRLSARPQLHVLGRIPNTTSWAPLSVESKVVQVEGVLVVLFATPLWYANSVHFHNQMDAARVRATGTLRLVVLDALGMSDIDYTGSKALRAVIDELKGNHIDFAVARAGKRVCEAMKKSGLYERIGADHFFPAVDEAVTTLGPKSPAA